MAEPYPNLPVGLNQLYQYDGNVLPSFETTTTTGMALGYGNRFGGGTSIVSDATAPIDASSVFRFTYGVGLSPGTSGGQANVWGTHNPRVPTDEYYEAIWIKIVGNGTNFENPGTSPWKFNGFWGVGEPVGGYSGGMFALLEASNDLGNSPGTNNKLSTTFGMSVSRQSSSSELVRRIHGGNLTVGKWYRIEYYFRINTMGSANGLMKVWITNVTDSGSASLVINISNMLYRN